jgi:hypothetical protein
LASPPVVLGPRVTDASQLKARAQMSFWLNMFPRSA